jgi:hypothetical protein
MAINQLELTLVNNAPPMFSLEFQLTDRHPVRRAVLSKKELCALVTAADRLLARTPREL